MTQIGKSNVKWSEIRDALNRNGGSVSNKAEDAFKVSSKYQKWARWKPTKYNDDFHPASGNNDNKMWEASNDLFYGLKAPVFTKVSDIDDSIEDFDELWEVNPPTGKIKKDDGTYDPNEPFRLGDFAGHDIDSRHPINVSYGVDSIRYIEGAEQGSIFKCKFNDNRETDWVDITDLGLGYSEDLSNIDNFKSYYFGAVFVGPEGWSFVQTRDHQIGKSSADSTDENPSIYDDTNFIQPSFDAFKNNETIMLGDYKAYFAFFKDNWSTPHKGYNYNLELSNGFYLMPCRPVKFELFQKSGDIWVENITISKTTTDYNVTFTIVNESDSNLVLHNSGNSFQVGARKYQSDVDYYMSELYPDTEITIPGGGEKEIAAWLSHINGYDTDPQIGDYIDVQVLLKIDGLEKAQGRIINLV